MFHVGVIMPLEPLFPTELNIASVIRWPGHTCLGTESHIWSLFPAGPWRPQRYDLFSRQGIPEIHRAITR